MEMKKEYPNRVCRKCGKEANLLTCLERFGENFDIKKFKPAFDISTFHASKCDICGRKIGVTEPRDFFYPDFTLLNRPIIKKRLLALLDKLYPMKTMTVKVGQDMDVRTKVSEILVKYNMPTRQMAISEIVNLLKEYKPKSAFESNKSIKLSIKRDEDR